MQVTTKYRNEDEKSEYVKKCERKFVDSVKECANRIASDVNLKFITLSGPTCSGKTTAAEILKKTLDALGRKTEVISIDDFYYERDSLSKDGKIDYDSVSTIDLEFLRETICGIDKGTEVKVPVYSFKVGKRIGYRDYTAGENVITMFEGIQAIYPEVRGLFDKNETRSIYISVEDDIYIGETKIDSRTVRLFRRLVRDCEARCAKPEFTLKIWESVTENEDRSILPYKDECDFHINSLMGYELNVIKKPLLKLLYSADSYVAEDLRDENDLHGKYSEFERETAEILKEIEPISKKYLPDDSLYREFIG